MVATIAHRVVSTRELTIGKVGCQQDSCGANQDRSEVSALLARVDALTLRRKLGSQDVQLPTDLYARADVHARTGRDEHAASHQAPGTGGDDRPG